MPQAAAAVGINADSCRKGVCGELGAATGAVERQLMGTVNVDELRRDQQVQLSHAARFDSERVGPDYQPQVRSGWRWQTDNSEWHLAAPMERSDRRSSLRLT